MLVNMSMVEPGYQGPLACLFANFGNDSVPITPSTVVTKLVFMKMKHQSEHPYSERISPEKYDEELRNVSLRAPRSFLRVSEQAKNLENEYEELRDRLRTETETAYRDLTIRFQADLPKNFIWPVFWRAVLAVALLTAIVSLLNLTADWIRPRKEDIIKQTVRDEVRQAIEQSRSKGPPPTPTQGPKGPGQ